MIKDKQKPKQKYWLWYAGKNVQKMQAINRQAENNKCMKKYKTY